ncbi:hypothetical protein ACJX0J_021545, partial [Zea mays]
ALDPHSPQKLPFTAQSFFNKCAISIIKLISKLGPLLNFLSVFANESFLGSLLSLIVSLSAFAFLFSELVQLIDYFLPCPFVYFALIDMGICSPDATNLSTIAIAFSSDGKHLHPQDHFIQTELKGIYF